MILSNKGQEIFERIKKIIRQVKFPDTSITVSEHNSAVLVRGMASKINKGIEQRDAAIIAGARGATTLLYDEGRLFMPGVEGEVEDSVKKMIMEELNPKKMM